MEKNSTQKAKIFAVVAAALVVVGIFSEPAPKEKAASVTQEPTVEQPTAPPIWESDAYKLKQDQIKEYFLSEKEPRVKDATWTAHDVFKVAVFSRENELYDGYAEYVCQTIHNEFCLNEERIWVQVMDMAEILRGHFKRIGETWCEPTSGPTILMEMVDGKLQPAKNQPPDLDRCKTN